MRIVILGAGITGLAAALHLLGNGNEITILEKRHKPGGLAATLNWKNHVFDYGAFVCYPLLEALLPEPVRSAINWRKLDSITSQLYLDNHFVNWPITPLYLFHQLGLKGSAAVLTDLIKTWLSPVNPGKIKNARNSLIKKIGQRLTRFSHIEEEIFKLTGRQSSELSPQFVLDHLLRFERMSPGKLILNQLRRQKVPLVNVYPRYPLGGIARIPLEIEKFLTANGVITRKPVNIKRIGSSGNSVTGVIFTQNGRQYKLDTDFVISTIPLTRTRRLLDKNRGQQSLKDKLHFRHLLLLFLILQKPSLTNKQLTYVFEDGIPFKRLVEFKHYDDRNIPHHQTGIAIEICYSNEDEIRDKAKVYSQVVKSLTQMGIIEPGDIVDYCFRVSHHAYPVETLGYEKTREEILDEITFNNMISCGRQGIFRYSQMSFAYKMGMAAADHINRKLLKKDRHLELCYDFAYRKTISGE